MRWGFTPLMLLLLPRPPSLLSFWAKGMVALQTRGVLTIQAGQFLEKENWTSHWMSLKSINTIITVDFCSFSKKNMRTEHDLRCLIYCSAIDNQKYTCCHHCCVVFVKSAWLKWTSVITMNLSKERLVHHLPYSPLFSWDLNVTKIFSAHFTSL